MTEKLYLHSIESGYYQDFNAKVIGVEDAKVILDQTLFYPLGGGQNWDVGTLTGPNGNLEVSEVRGRDAVLHTVGEGHQLEIGDEVKGTIDWERRHAHMRMHTAQHLVSGLVYECLTVHVLWEIKFTVIVLE
jgi:misacylated tRNA(Ala) deacylase